MSQHRYYARERVEPTRRTPQTGPEAPTVNDAVLAYLWEHHRDDLDSAPEVLEVMHVRTRKVRTAKTPLLIKWIHRIRFWDCEGHSEDRLYHKTPEDAVVDYLEYLDAGGEETPDELKVTGYAPAQVILHYKRHVLDPIYEDLEDEHGGSERDHQEPGPEVVEAAKRLVDLILEDYIPWTHEEVVTWFVPGKNYR